MDQESMLNDIEKKEYEEFKLKHNTKHKKNNKPYLFKFTPTGIGTCIIVKCPYCKKTKDITDVSCW